jgi:DNA-3-methyladenine glycosylase I
MAIVQPKRCAWCGDDPVYVAYHDHEWGVPIHEDRRWFEMLTLEGFQAGLSWITVLRKREHYRTAFDNFDPILVAAYDTAKIETLMGNANLIRNRLKMNAAVSNARAFLEVQREFGSFDAYIWQFVGGKPLVNAWATLKDVPPETAESRAMSKALKKRGFKFVGATICYALMQASGMVNDHTLNCDWREKVMTR